MEDNIIHNYENLSLGEANKIASLTLKVNSELKKAGFKKVVVSHEYIKSDTMEDELTVYFSPLFEGIDYYERNAERESFIEFVNHMRDLNGNYWYGRYYSLRPNSFDNLISLKVKYKEKSFEIGHYLPDRNIVVIYLSMLHNWELGLENKYILEVLRYVKILAKEHKFKAVDVSIAREKILLSNFTREINNNIRDEEGFIISSESWIEEYSAKMVEKYRKINFGIKKVESLKIFSKQIKGGLLEKIKEIKELKFVKSAELSNDGIVIKFNEIFIKVNGDDIRMGNYTITLFPNKIGIINSKPVTTENNTYHSPHIKNDTICYGSQDSMAYKLLGNLDFKKLTHFLWLYLNSYNEGDTYLPMRDWIAGRENNDIVPIIDEYEEDDE